MKSPLFPKKRQLSHIFGQKSYNGVALISKVKIDKIDLQFIEITLGRLICTYASRSFSYYVLKNTTGPITTWFWK